MAGGGQQAPGLGRIVAIVARAFAELVERQRPVGERRRHGAVAHADPLERGVDEPLTVDGERDRLTDPRVLEGRAIGPQGEVVHDVGRELHRAQARTPLLQRVGELDPVGAVDHAGELPPEVVLATEERRDPRGVVLVHQHLDAIDVGQGGHEVVRVAHEGERHVGPVGLERVGAGPDDRLGLPEVAERLDALLGDDRARHGVGDHLEEPRERLLQGEADGVPVDGLHLGDGAVHRDVGAALVAEDALEGVAHVVGRELATVDGRLGVEAHALAELEDVGRVAGLLPRLGQVTFELERARPDRGTSPVPEQAAVREADHHVGLVGVGQDVVEVRRVPRA